MVDRRSAQIPYECPACKNIHEWSRAGAFCRMRCFYKWLGTDKNKLDNINSIIRTSADNAYEKLQENA